MPKPFYRSLQAGRGLAALAVVLHHVGINVGLDVRYWHNHTAGVCFEGFALGIAYFFVLSGVVLVTAHRQDFDRPAALPAYFWRRFLRIYPVYWLALLPYYLRHGGPVAAAGNGWVTVSSLLLVHIRSHNLVLLVAWTLVHEVMFYLFFATLLVRRWLGSAVLGTWFLLSIVSLFRHFPTYVDEWLSPLHLLFGVGIACAWWIGKDRMRFSLAMAILGAAGFLPLLVLAARSGLNLWLQLAAGAASALLLVGCVGLEREGRLQVPAWLNYLGAASYAIYLVHGPVMARLVPLVYRVLPYGGAMIVLPFAALTLLCVAAGCLFHSVIERPLLRLLMSLPVRRGRVREVRG